MPLTKVDKIFPPGEIDGWKFFSSTERNVNILLRSGTSVNLEKVLETIKFTHRSYKYSKNIDPKMFDQWLMAEGSGTDVAQLYREDPATKLYMPTCGTFNCTRIMCNYITKESISVAPGFCFFLSEEDARNQTVYCGTLIKCRMRGVTYAGSNSHRCTPYFALAQEMYIPRVEVIRSLSMLQREKLDDVIRNYGELA